MHDTISLQRFSSRERHIESSSDCDTIRKTSVTAEHSSQAANALKIIFHCKNKKLTYQPNLCKYHQQIQIISLKWPNLIKSFDDQNVNLPKPSYKGNFCD
jgi:hypothetical protein